MQKFVVQDEPQWARVAQEIARNLKNKLLLLEGEMGARKTTFTQHLVRALGSQDQVSSPTYALVNEYHCPAGVIYHLDLYRLRDFREVVDLDLDSYINTAHLMIIEWPQIAMPELSQYACHTATIENHTAYRTMIFI